MTVWYIVDFENDSGRWWKQAKSYLRKSTLFRKHVNLVAITKKTFEELGDKGSDYCIHIKSSSDLPQAADVTIHFTTINLFKTLPSGDSIVVVYGVVDMPLLFLRYNNWKNQKELPLMKLTQSILFLQNIVYIISRKETWIRQPLLNGRYL